MSDINHVTLIGHLTRDIELKYTSAGLPIGKLSIAINRMKKKGDVWEKEVNFFNITLIGKIAESLRAYLLKGKLIAVEGELHQSRWESNGQQRTAIDVIARNIQLLSSQGKSRTQDPPVDDFQDDIPI